jgi:hypothetical protein
VVAAFKATVAQARETSAAVRIGAGTAGMDGFYYACLEKAPRATFSNAPEKPEGQ